MYNPINKAHGVGTNNNIYSKSNNINKINYELMLQRRCDGIHIDSME